jgi:hypothetical protein
VTVQLEGYAGRGNRVSNGVTSCHAARRCSADHSQYFDFACGTGRYSFDVTATAKFRSRRGKWRRVKVRVGKSASISGHYRNDCRR